MRAPRTFVRVAATGGWYLPGDARLDCRASESAATEQQSQTPKAGAPDRNEARVFVAAFPDRLRGDKLPVLHLACVVSTSRTDFIREMRSQSGVRLVR